MPSSMECLEGVNDIGLEPWSAVGIQMLYLEYVLSPPVLFT